MRLIAALIVNILAVPAPVDAQLTVMPVADDIYAIVGPLGQRDAENLGNNATFGLLVTDEGAVLIDPGGSHQGAAMLHAAVKTVTDQPVTHVINTGGQDHRWIGNSYWQALGATVIASEAAVADQRSRASLQQTVLRALIGDGLDGTEPSFADVTFSGGHRLTLGGETLEIVHAGAAHTPGDAFVWHAASGTVFTGDIVYVDRTLGVMEFSDSAEWVSTFEAMASLDPDHVVPGHGPATDMLTATRDTYDYLVNLRTRMRDHIDAGGDIIGSVGVDQSEFSYLHNFEALAGRNAQEVFSQMEWE